MFKYVRLYTIVVLLISLVAPAASAPAWAAANSARAAIGKAAPSATIGAKGVAGVLAKKPRWSGGTAYDVDEGVWKATVTDRQSGNTYTWGSYESQGEAQEAGNDYAGELNKRGVVGAPPCNTWPLFLEC